MKRILILTAGFGEGHNSAAKGLLNALARQSDPVPLAETHDLFKECYGSVNEFVRKAYLGAINRAPKVWQQIYEMIDRTDMVSGNLGVLSRMRDHLERQIDAYKPDAIVSTYPIYGYLLDRIYRNRKPGNFKFFTIVTDSISINSVWTKCSCDWLLVPNRETEEVITRMGIKSGEIRTIGFPVDPQFADFSSGDHKARQPGEPWRVLYMVNSGKKHAPALAKKIAAMDNIALTVTAGKNEKLRAEITEACKGAKNPIETIGWTDEIPLLMSRSHCLIGKAGGATVQEALAAACPMIITQVVPGQEEGNAQLIVRNECGCISVNAELGIPAILERILSNDAKEMNDWLENIRRVSKPSASLDIARFILENSD